MAVSGQARATRLIVGAVGLVFGIWLVVTVAVGAWHDFHPHTSERCTTAPETFYDSSTGRTVDYLGVVCTP